MPPFYPGSGKTADVIAGRYHGSVGSKRYKTIWKQELKEHPELFKTMPFCYYSDREEATKKEYKLQKQLKVVKNPLYINQAYATVGGSHGRDVSGKLNPAYGKSYPHSEEWKRNHSKMMRGRKGAPSPKSAAWRKNHSDKTKGRVAWNNGEITKKAINCPGEGWMRGHLPRGPRSKPYIIKNRGVNIGMHWWVDHSNVPVRNKLSPGKTYHLGRVFQEEKLKEKS